MIADLLPTSFSAACSRCPYFGGVRRWKELVNGTKLGSCCRRALGVSVLWLLSTLMSCLILGSLLSLRIDLRCVASGELSVLGTRLLI